MTCTSFNLFSHSSYLCDILVPPGISNADYQRPVINSQFGQVVREIVAVQGYLVDGKIGIPAKTIGDESSYMTGIADALGMKGYADYSSSASELKAKMIHKWNLVLAKRCVNHSHASGWDNMMVVFKHPDIKADWKENPPLHMSKLRKLTEDEVQKLHE